MKNIDNEFITYKQTCKFLDELGVLKEALREFDASDWKYDGDLDLSRLQSWFPFNGASKGGSYWFQVCIDIESKYVNLILTALGNGSCLKGKLAVYNSMLSFFESPSTRIGFCGALNKLSGCFDLENFEELMQQKPDTDTQWWFITVKDKPDFNRIKCLKAAIALVEQKINQQNNEQTKEVLPER